MDEQAHEPPHHYQPNQLQPSENSWQSAVANDSVEPVQQNWPPPPHAVVIPEAQPPHHPAAVVAIPAATLRADDDQLLRPVPVVRVLSPIGVEYVFMIIALFMASIGLAAALISLVNSKIDFSVLAFPTALLITGVPVVAGLFLHLKKLETANPALKLDPSKRRSTQTAQVISFVISLFTLVGLIYAIFAKLGGQSSLSIGKAILDALCILVVAGGILAYYWHDEHHA